jgi:hypothetical protein
VRSGEWASLGGVAWCARLAVKRISALECAVPRVAELRTEVLSRTIDALDDCCFFVPGCESTADSPRAARARGAYRL